MRKIKFSVLFFISLFLLSCNKDDSKSCLSPKTIMINSISQEGSFDGLNLVYENSNYKVYFSKYISSNADGYRDSSGLFILKLDNSIAYTNYDFFDNQINIPTTFDPSDYFSTGSIKISDNCNQLFFTDNINQLFWYPTYSPEKQAEGIYNVELKLKLIDNTDVLVNTQVEVIRYN